MSPDALVNVSCALLLLVLLTGLLGYLHPPTRPLVRRWGWALAAFGLVLLGGLIAGLVGRPRGARPGKGSPVADTAATGQAIQQAGAVALAHQADADAELARQRLAARAHDPHGAAVLQYDVDLSKVRAIADPIERRRALVALVERVR